MKLQTFFERFDLFADAPDAVAKMRELVLQLAVTGKLVAQEKRDEPASSLLKCMEVERAKLVAAKKIKSRPTTRVDDDKKPYELPSSWAWARLLDVGYELGQKVPDKRFTYIDVGSIDSEKGRISGRVEKLEPGDAPSRARKLVTRGTVIYSTVRPYLLNIAIVDEDFDPEPIASTAFGILHPFSGVNNRYLFYWLRSAPFTAYVQAGMKGMAYPAINDEKFYSGYIALPPSAEQKRIVAKVDELMALCNRLEAEQQERETRHAALARASLARFAAAPSPRNLNLVFHPSYPILPADFRKSILTLAVQGKLVPQDSADGDSAEDSGRAARKRASLPVRELAEPAPNEMPFEAPASWRWVTVADVADTRLGKMLDKQKNRGEAHPYLRNTNVHWFRFELESIKTMLFESSELNEYRVEPGDVLICEGGHGIARSAVWGWQIPGIMFQKALHRVRPLSCLSGHFLTFCLWVYERDEILHHYYTGAGIPHFTGKALARVTFPLPPLAEQRRIVAKVEQLMASVDDLEGQLAASRATAANLLEALVTELASPQTSDEAGKAKIIDLRSSPEFIRAALAAEIVERMHQHPTFGRIKLQKVIYLAEYVAQLSEIDSHPRRFANGPHDPALILEVEQKMEACQWYKAVPRNGSGFIYRPLSEAGKQHAYFNKFWHNEASVINALISKMQYWKTERCERFATVYAAWNDLILWGVPVTDQAILKEILQHWHPEKLNIPEAKWMETLDWIRREGYIPTGFGRATAAAPQAELLPAMVTSQDPRR